jgi:hypothetical protein
MDVLMKDGGNIPESGTMLSKPVIARFSQSTMFFRSVRPTKPPAGRPCSRACFMYSPPGVSRNDHARQTASSMKKPSGSEVGFVAALPTLRSRVGAFFGKVTAVERRRWVAERRVLAGTPEEFTGSISYFALIAARRASSGSIALIPVNSSSEEIVVRVEARAEDIYYVNMPPVRPSPTPTYNCLTQFYLSHPSPRRTIIQFRGSFNGLDGLSTPPPSRHPCTPNSPSLCLSSRTGAHEQNRRAMLFCLHRAGTRLTTERTTRLQCPIKFIANERHGL